MTPIAFPLPFATDLGWFDISMSIVLGVFLLLGLFKGVYWQLGRAVLLIAAYAVALLFGPRVAPSLSRFMAEGTGPEVLNHVAYLSLFVGAVVLFGLLTWLIQRFVPVKPLTRSHRLFGALVGVLTGSMVVLAVLTGIAMFLPDRGVARAAESSGTSQVGRHALAFAERVLPADIGSGAREWRELLEPTQASAGPSPVNDERSGRPVEGAFRESDGSSPQETPRKSLAPQKR